MTSKHKVFVENCRAGGRSDEEIITWLIERLERKDYLNDGYRKVHKELKEQMIKAQFESGRRKSVCVDSILSTPWRKFVYYKDTRYCFNEKMKAWVKDTSKNSLMQHHVEHLPGKFHVELILSDEDMPEVFTGKCTGSVFGEKVITAKGHMIGYGDEFELRKVKNAV